MPLGKDWTSWNLVIGAVLAVVAAVVGWHRWSAARRTAPAGNTGVPLSKTNAGERPQHVALDGGTVRFEVRSRYIVLIDPLALDGLASELMALSDASEQARLARIRYLGAEPLRIGVHDLGVARPGRYELSAASLEQAEDIPSDSSVVTVDSGVIVLVDLDAHPDVARALTWDRYDWWLQQPRDDHRVLHEITRDAGGPRFAILGSNADTTEFGGDGCYRLRGCALVE